MKRLLLMLAAAIFILPGASALAQGMSLNTTGTAAHSSAMLDVASTTKGMLIPRMTTTHRTGISAPAKGLLVFDSTLASFYYYTGSAWTAIGSNTLPSGSAGDILYNNGSAWVTLPPGTTEQVLTMAGGMPAWVSPLTFAISATYTGYGTITSPGVSPLLRGTSLTYTIVPNAGGSIFDVIVDGSSVGSVSTYTFSSISANHTINVIFLGGSYGGGVIAYVLVPGDPGYDPTTPHGLIAAPSDQSTFIQWYNGTYTVTGATGTAIGTGLSNTLAIIANQGPGSYAAQLARLYTGGGYTDWYLPSLDELYKICIHGAAIGMFYGAEYWSSTEYGTGGAWICGRGVGETPDAKSLYYSVRAVRAF